MSLPSSAPRRISYVIPAPSAPPPRLVLPPLDAPRSGRTVPLIIPAQTNDVDRDDHLPPLSTATLRPAHGNPSFSSMPSGLHHPRHRLGVSALALDTSTQLEGRSCPEGILYSGGRDGLILAWELGIPMKRRMRKYGAETSDRRRRLRRKTGTWETMTGWDDYDDDDIEDAESSEDEEQISSPWVLGALRNGLDDLSPEIPFAPGPDQKELVPDSTIPYESRWQADASRLDYAQPRAYFRQCVQPHTDWVNDILLCNMNQTLISASSDGTVKAWNPHLTTSLPNPTVIGKHGDYARCLAYSPHKQWVASGSFDRTIKLWDVGASSKSSSASLTPLATLSLPDSAAGPKASVYALATDLAGHIVAAGSPEKVVRTWDPRAGKKTGKLVGHTDNIRSIIVSEDGRYLLTGSSDASVKLWSLAAQRCLHTFNHHTDSVWALFSSHPNLEIFYSGDRSGLVCKVDMEGSADVSEGECVVICRESELQEDVGGGEYMGDRGYEGINKIVAMDDTFVWTATGSSSIKRWRDPGRRATRAENAEKSPMPVGLLPTESASRHNSLGLLSGTPILRSNDSSQDSFLGDDTVVLPSNKIDTTSTIPISSGPSFSSIYKRDSLRSDTLLSPPGTHPEATLFQIPFASLVRLASFNDPYSRNPTIVTTSRARDSEVATLYSAASVRSVPITRHFPPSRPTAQALHSAMRQQTIGSDTLGVSTPSPPAGAAGPPRFVFPPDGAADVYSPSARAEYEEREIAADAIPLRLQPDEIILGSHGLVRSIILNDRMHALTVDTAGEVAIWDLIRGTCIGVFAKEDVENASNEGSGSKGTGAGSNGLAFGRSPREALESVRERIEGEGMVAAWSTVDTRIGDLTVHMLDQRCFEAEVYMDEAGLSDMKGFQEEQRVNVGKWILSNLFAGFVQAELRQNASTAVPTPAVPPTPSTGIRRGPAPSHINFESTGGASSRRPRTLSDIGTWTARTPGIAISLNTPSMTPAVLPELPPPSPTVSRQAPKEHGLSTIPHSPVVPGSPPPMPSISAVPSSFPTKTPSAKDTNEPDYFSLRVNPKKSFHGRSLTDTDDAANHNHNGAQKGPAAQELQTPGGGFMGRLRNFGKNKRAAASESGAPTPAPIPEGDEKRSEDKIISHPHLRYLDKLFSEPLNPPSELDAPSIALPPNMRVLISEQSPDAGGWDTVYHGLVSTVEEDIEELERASPPWLLECIFNNRGVQPPSAAMKFSFVITPWIKGEGPPLPELLSSQARLTANRVLRVRKILIYVKEKMDESLKELAEGKTVDATAHQRTPSNTNPTPVKDAPAATLLPESLSASPKRTPSSSTPSLVDDGVKAEELYELLCNDVVLPVNMTLAAVRHYIWRQGGELSLQYRRKAAIP